ncbi:ferrochelatase [Vibrio sp.]|nr:ferrochelatase [Vibrio sp.]
MDNNTQRKQGVLLVNLGTPSAPTASAVKSFLGQFLHDHRVVSLNRFIWCPILHGIILPFRSPKVAKLYDMVWMEEGSPLMVYSKRQMSKLDERLDIPVSLGMTYGDPSIESGIDELLDQGVNDIIVLPLYPQYSSTTTAAVSDALHRAFKKKKVLPTYKLIANYHQHPLFIDALAQSVTQFREAHGQSDYLLCSYHGIPQRLADQGDTYPQHCEETTTLLAKSLNLNSDEMGMSYQSRFGREEWLKPYTDKALELLPKKGVTRIDIMAPAFSVDCLETLEEIAEQCKETFIDAGGVEFRYIPCLNDNAEHIDMMAALIEEHR